MGHCWAVGGSRANGSSSFFPTQQRAPGARAPPRAALLATCCPGKLLGAWGGGLESRRAWARLPGGGAGSPASAARRSPGSPVRLGAAAMSAPGRAPGPTAAFPARLSRACARRWLPPRPSRALARPALPAEPPGSRNFGAALARSVHPTRHRAPGTRRGSPLTRRRRARLAGPGAAAPCPQVGAPGPLRWTRSAPLLPLPPSRRLPPPPPPPTTPPPPPAARRAQSSPTREAQGREPPETWILGVGWRPAWRGDDCCAPDQPRGESPASAGRGRLGEAPRPSVWGGVGCTGTLEGAPPDVPRGGWGPMVAPSLLALPCRPPTADGELASASATLPSPAALCAYTPHRGRRSQTESPCFVHCFEFSGYALCSSLTS